MNRILEVTKILYKNTQSVVFDTPPHRSIEDVAKQINQLYEPQPDQPKRCSECGGTKILTYHNQTEGEILRRDCPYCKPDQSRLLTDEKIKTLPIIDRISRSDKPLWLKRCISVAEAQRDLTASIKDAEIDKRDKRILELQDSFRMSQEMSDARIEALIEELDTFCVNYDHYGTDKRANTRRRCCNKCWQELKATHCKGEEG